MANSLYKWAIGILLFSAPMAGGRQLTVIEFDAVITEADCTVRKLGTSIPASVIKEPVSGVELSAPRWNAATATVPAHCSVDGSMAPVDRSSTGKPIQFRVLLPASWNRRAAQLGGGGTNGVIPNLTGEPSYRLQHGSMTVVIAMREVEPKNVDADRNQLLQHLRAARRWSNSRDDLGVAHHYRVHLNRACPRSRRRPFSITSARFARGHIPSSK